jgi:monomeric sarcosine oxidase
MGDYDVLIIGGGVMGAATAGEVARSGARVGLVDQAPLPNPRGASIDHSKVFRFAYPDPFYVKLAVDSLPLWQELERESGETLMIRSGLVLLAAGHEGFERECFEALRGSGLEAEQLSRRDLAARFPQFNADALQFAIYDPSGATLNAAACVRVMLELARRRGVEIIEDRRVATVRSGESGQIAVETEAGERLLCRKLLVAAGPWTRRLLPELDSLLTTTSQEVVYFEPLPGRADDFAPERFPIFLELSSGYYGFPTHHRGAMKIANHHKGPRVDPYSSDQEVDRGFIDACRRFFAEYIPELADAKATESRICLYNNTPDDDFVIDWHPSIDGLLISTGFSGHGFKFGPIIGRITAEMLLSGSSSRDIERFRISRFGKEVIE